MTTSALDIDSAVNLAESHPKRPTVLIVHASVGSGHKSAANAIAEALIRLRDDPAFADEVDVDVPTDVEVEVLDILDFGRVIFDGDKTASLFTGFTRPIYDLTWRYTLTGRLLWAGGTIWARVNFPRFVEHVREVEPIAVIATHITAANTAVSARMITGQHFPIVCVPTDYEVEGMWPHLYTDLFCVANESMAETLRPRKVPESRIRITGIPTRLAFRRTFDRTAIREEFGLPQDKRVVLALAGASLPRPYIHMRKQLDEVVALWNQFEDMHLVIIGGHDEEYVQHVRDLASLCGAKNVTVFGYVDKVAELMAASDLVICKSGGLTVTECLCANAPMVLLGRAYGQEKANVRMLTASGAALSVTTARELIELLRRYEEHPEITEALLLNSSFIRRPDAAIEIVRDTFELVAKEQRDPRLFKKHFLHFYFGGKPAHER